MRVGVKKTAALGEAVNLAAGHVVEMAGSTIAESSPCPVGRAIGSTIEDAGRAWSDAAVRVARRDAERLTE